MRKNSQNISNQPISLTKKTAATKADHHLHHLAFDNAAQANIITIASSGKIIIANSAACQLLGYSKKLLLTKSRSGIFKINDSSFKKMLKQRTSEGHSKAMVISIRKNGTTFPCEITSAVFMDNDGVEKAITTIMDLSQHVLDQKNIDTAKEKIVTDNIVIAKSKQKTIDVKKDKAVAHNIVVAKSKQKKIDIKKEQIVASNIIIAQTISDERLADNNAWIKHIAETSYDVMWDWDIASGKIYVGESVREVFGYEIKSNTMIFDDFFNRLVEEEKQKVTKNLKAALASTAKSWDDAFMFKRYDDSVASTICRASIVRDSKGKAIRLIGALQDITLLQEMERKLEDQAVIQKAEGERFLLAAKLSFDVIWDWDLVTNEVFIGEGFEELFGYVIKENRGNMITNWSNYMHPDDKKQIEKELSDSIKSTAMQWEHAYRVIRADGSIAKVFARASIIRHANGKAYRMIGAMQDLSRQKELEEELDNEIKLKEKQMSQAAEDAKEMERSNIGKELHDNINQLLGASRMYLEMAKRGGPNSSMYLSRSSEYTLTAIEEIRKLSKGLTTDIIKNLGLCIAIDNLVMDMAEVNAVKISCSLEGFNEKIVTDKLKLNIFRIVQEHLNNILKHAKATQVDIRLSQNKNAVELGIIDNGVGFDTEKKQTGIGVDNIKSRAKSYNGEANFVSQPGSGCRLTVTFPVAA
jgi:PAS domain S-box-containing protein